ncbi:MAG: S41 family peptidase [Bacillota bacterium]|nr:S41 family peptidase [Bacillota bacterium]
MSANFLGRLRLRWAAVLLAVSLAFAALPQGWAAAQAAQAAPPASPVGAAPSAGAGEPSSGDAAGSPSGSPAGAELFDAVRQLIEQVYVNPVSSDQLWQGSIQGLLESLGDPYSVYMTPDEYRSFSNQVVTGQLEGIGVQIESINGLVTVVAPISGSPAARAGLRAGDRILAVDGQDARGWTTQEAASHIQGPSGTRVTLTLQRGNGAPFQVTLTRAPIRIQPVTVKTLPGGIVDLVISSFDQETGDTVALVTQFFRMQGKDRFILDLRNNPGGLLSQGVQVASVFVPQGPVVRIRTRGETAQDEQVLSSSTPPWSFKLAVLVNEGTASAAEIVAGAIQDRGVGKVIGTRTFGKGSVQQIFELPDGGAIKLTTARYYTPDGHAVDGVGIRPDLAVPDPQGPGLGPLRPSRVLRPGMVGLDVLGMQGYLRAWGFDPGPQDGIFGPRTERALRAWEAAVNRQVWRNEPYLVQAPVLPAGRLRSDGLLDATEADVLAQPPVVDRQLEAAVRDLLSR